MKSRSRHGEEKLWNTIQKMKHEMNGSTFLALSSLCNLRHLMEEIIVILYNNMRWKVERITTKICFYR